jgi:predicted Na+-dependent transporter
MVWVQTTAAVFCAALTVVTASHFGIVAAAAATSLTKLIVTVVLIVMFVRGTGISPGRLLLVQREDVRHYFDFFESMLRTLRWRSA